MSYEYIYRVEYLTYNHIITYDKNKEQSLNHHYSHKAILFCLIPQDGDVTMNINEIESKEELDQLYQIISEKLATWINDEVWYIKDIEYIGEIEEPYIIKDKVKPIVDGKIISLSEFKRR